jgi:hypothetical protein
VTLAQLNRALARVTRELDAQGLWNDRVAAADVRLVPVGRRYGWQWYGGTGAIDIPAVSMNRLWDLLVGRYTSLAGILRHEYAHVIADTHRGLMRSRRFRDVFDAAHGDESPFVHDPELHVSKYAASMAAEDFAETFRLWLRHRGVMPTRFVGLPAIEAKWQFIGALRDAIRDGRRRW